MEVVSGSSEKELSGLFVNAVSGSNDWSGRVEAASARLLDSTA